MGKPGVMLTNDDGWDSVGLIASWRALQGLADTLVVAPKFQVSGVGKAMTIDRPLTVSSFTFQDMRGYRIDGTPADCLLIGLHKIARRRPELVVSGINLGPNLGLDDLTSSGTMGACLQAAMYRIPSICISYCLSDYTRKVPREELAPSARLLRWIATEILKNGMPKGIQILIVAIPEGKSFTEALETRLAISPLPDIHEEVREGKYMFMPRTIDTYTSEAEADDVDAILKGRVSITPLSLDQLGEPANRLERFVSRLNDSLRERQGSPIRP